MLKRLFIFGLIIACAGIIYFKRAEIKLFLVGNLKTINTSEAKLLITSDLTPDSMANYLVAKNILSEPKVFLKEIEKQGLSNETIDAGKYVVLSGTAISDLVHGFSRGENGHGIAEIKVNVIFNRSKTIADVGMNISKCIEADSASIVDYILSSSTLSKYGFTKQQVPALFIPNQYELYYDTNAEEFVAFMAEQFKNYWTAEKIEQVKSLGLSGPSQAVTLASIVYSEQGKIASEWPIIAKLYLNRINKGMKLQSDPTFKYCWEGKLEGVQRLKSNHRNINCEYNTYKINGLPPGPICLVPTKVIDAVLSPDNNNYLFMCAKPDYSGEHNFTHSDVVHLKNASEYHRWLSKQGKN
ncbi:MAG: endolytic transglycosylase MltG [Crocinitomicaceae bacterium]|nr:endolytic transglycosylase MltG [Crocinitomicaceae bacterium]